MIELSPLFQLIEEQGIKFFSGVPDSLTAKLILEIEEFARLHHAIKLIPAANEGLAVSMSIGSYLAIGKPGVIYMQNSGLANALNPLLSLAHHSVFNIPVILLIGWRGEPLHTDEPQHQLQGKLTLSFLSAIDAKYEVVRNDVDFERAIVNLQKLLSTKELKIFAFVFSREAFN